MPGDPAVFSSCTTGNSDEENTSFNTQIVHKALYSNLRHCDVCVIDAVFV
jgi:hypothetical protein